MSRTVQIALLCEDRQHETFARRFLNRMGWSTRQMRVVPRVSGSAEQFVRETFPVELKAYRSKRGHGKRTLIVIIDGDRYGPQDRLASLDAECARQNVAPRTDTERVGVFVPTWCMETWLAYLAGESVDESNRTYPKLSRPRDCQPHVDELARMCRQRALRQPEPPSLVAACAEYNTRLAT